MKYGGEYNNKQICYYLQSASKLAVKFDVIVNLAITKLLQYYSTETRANEQVFFGCILYISWMDLSFFLFLSLSLM